MLYLLARVPIFCDLPSRRIFDWAVSAIRRKPLTSISYNPRTKWLRLKVAENGDTV
jgi:hypothetical protein